MVFVRRMRAAGSSAARAWLGMPAKLKVAPELRRFAHGSYVLARAGGL
jgi:hypothetical protein